MISAVDEKTRSMIANWDRQQKNQDDLTSIFVNNSMKQGRNAVIVGMAETFQKTSKSFTEKLSQIAS